MVIKSQYKLGYKLAHFTQAQIKSEPMFHKASKEFAYDMGSQITKEFLNFLDWREPLIIDSRVHMLMPGMYPCIPGWHHDDVPRERSDGQPNYENPSYKAEHCMALWGDCSLTEFALGTHEVEIPSVGKKIYKELSKFIDWHCEHGDLDKVTSPEAQQIFFDWQTWHRGAPTTKTGFRFFIRATRFTKLEPLNEIRYNANVYMPIIEEGW